MVRNFLAVLVVVGLVMISQRPAVAKAPPANGTADSKNKTKQFDTDGDGKLSTAEKVAAKNNPEGRPGRQELDALLRKFDANGNGKLDPDERVKAREAAKEYKDKLEASRAAAAGQTGQQLQPGNRGPQGGPNGQGMGQGNGQGNGQQLRGPNGNQFPGGRPANFARPGQPGPQNRPVNR